MTPEKTWVGIDVSQAQLDSQILPQGLVLAHPHHEVGMQTLIDQLLPLSATLVVVESTGGLERKTGSRMTSGSHSRGGCQSSQSQRLCGGAGDS